MIKFPKNFLWGTATSAHQIEGDNFNNDWWDAEQGTGRYPAEQKGLLPKSGKACDSYNRYEEDFDRAVEMHNNAHRFSIEWSRIEPEEGKFDQGEIEHYRKVLQSLRARGLEPFVVLHHFTNPIWFAKKGGWANKKAPEYFERYAEFVASQLGDIKYWITINEPMIYVSMLHLKGGVWGGWPNSEKSYSKAYAVVKNFISSHNKAFSKIKREIPGAEVGISKNYSYFFPFKNYFWNKLFAFIVSYFWNDYILKRIKIDFIGFNYYHRNTIRIGISSPKNWLNQNENKEVSDMGWEIYPEGIYYAAKNFNKYHKPIYVTENGIADADDDQRPDFIRNHLIWLHKAIEEGADVRGYFYWSLLDNFEWAEGFKQRFGLVEVNFETFERKIRPSGKLYGEIAKNNGF